MGSKPSIFQNLAKIGTTFISRSFSALKDAADKAKELTLS